MTKQLPKEIQEAIDKIWLHIKALYIEKQPHWNVSLEERTDEIIKAHLSPYLSLPQEPTPEQEDDFVKEFVKDAEDEIMEIKIQHHFEANMLDWDDVNNCWWAMLAADSVLGYIQEFYVLKVEEQGEKIEKIEKIQLMPDSDALSHMSNPIVLANRLFFKDWVNTLKINELVEAVNFLIDKQNNDWK